MFDRILGAFALVVVCGNGAHADSWKFLGSGLTANAWRNGAVVRKELKPTYANRVHKLAEAYRRLKEDPFMSVVMPSTTFHSNGVIEQTAVDGFTLAEVPLEEQEIARDNIDWYVKRARSLGSGGIDKNPANFRFNKVGHVIGWFDPIVPGPES